MSAKWILQFVALTFAITAMLVILVVPRYVRVVSDSAGNESIETQRLLEVMGPGYLAVLAVPVVLAAASLLTGTRGWQPVSVVSAALLTVFVLLGSLNIGFYFFPATVAAIVATVLPPRSRAR